jgi:hypothetical protein
MAPKHVVEAELGPEGVLEVLARDGAGQAEVEQVESLRTGLLAELTHAAPELFGLEVRSSLELFPGPPLETAPGDHGFETPRNGVCGDPGDLDPDRVENCERRHLEVGDAPCRCQAGSLQRGAEGPESGSLSRIAEKTEQTAVQEIAELDLSTVRLTMEDHPGHVDRVLWEQRGKGQDGTIVSAA